MAEQTLTTVYAYGEDKSTFEHARINIDTVHPAIGPARVGLSMTAPTLCLSWRKN